MAHKLEELPVFSKAEAFSIAVSETLSRSKLRKNSKTYEQIEDANDSILANMDEGFEQSTDDGFAKYLVYSKGSVAEVMRRLRRAARKGFVAPAELPALDEMAEPLGKMLGGFIKYLRRSGFKDRGSFSPSSTASTASTDSKDSGSRISDSG